MQNEKTSINPLLCNPDSGVCEIPGVIESQLSGEITTTEKPVTIIYFTDPICSSCWGIEPQLRKLKLEYGNYIHIEYRMGGLLPNWSYNSGGISKPSDVAHHWDEVSKYYDMPIDGDVWLEDPLDSSYPPSIAFKAAQMQDEQKAIVFLRELREMVFLQKKNITKWEYMAIAASNAGLDANKLKIDYESNAHLLFEEDLKYARKLGVRGFPTLFFVDKNGAQEQIYGSRPYGDFETVLLKLAPNAQKVNYDRTWKALFLNYPSLTLNEFATLSGMPRKDAEMLLQQLTQDKFLSQIITKNGILWESNF